MTDFFFQVNFISRIGGESAYEFIKRVMGRLVTDEVAAKYSFTGHKGKRPIGQFLITKALKGMYFILLLCHKCHVKEQCL